MGDLTPLTSAALVTKLGMVHIGVVDIIRTISFFGRELFGQR
jgi:hypothetical protein